ncbi:hypothetical protein EHP00_190 [Ecytonucleospora hepatopenaei]|uniref:Uncharacterized protein n=1 Tax=Ecytonucleospora hepatopenaei TaxID=646526 RepID=A0A1W0E6G4_9MICR|nr:hypothetical protein EHP00_190 [Ecytonucleospora hepatopenaei]
MDKKSFKNNFKKSFRNNFKSILLRAFLDSWAVVLVFTLKNLFLNHTNILNLNYIAELKWIPYASKTIKNILTVVDDQNYSIIEAVWVYYTMYVIVVLCLIVLLLLSSIFYAINYKAHTVFMFLSANAALFWEATSYRSFYLQVFCVFSFVFFSLYKIHKAFTQINPGSKIVVETSDSLINFGIVFYLKMFFQFFMIFWKCFFIRTFNFKEKGYGQQFLFFLLLTYYGYGEIFMTQSLTTHMLSKKIYNDSPSFRFEFIALYFSAGVAAFVKIFMLVSNRLYFIIRIFAGNDFLYKYPFLKFFEDDRCYFFYIIFRRCSFFDGLCDFKNIFWNGAVRRHVRAINFKGDFLPTILCLFIALKKVLAQYDIIRPYDLFFILCVNGFVAIEIFNTYAIVKIMVYIKSKGEDEKINVGFSQGNQESGSDFVNITNSDLKMRDYFDNLFFKQHLLTVKTKSGDVFTKENHLNKQK